MYKWVFSERLKVTGDEHRRTASGRVFQARGPATAKARSPSLERHVAGTVKSAEEAERRRRHGLMFSTGRMTSCRYLGAYPCTQLKTSTQSLYWMRWGIRSQCRSTSNSVMWSWSCAPTVSAINCPCHSIKFVPVFPLLSHLSLHMSDHIYLSIHHSHHSLLPYSCILGLKPTCFTDLSHLRAFLSQD